MGKKLGIREARKAALMMGAAMLENEDFCSLFGELWDQHCDEDGADEIFHSAQIWAHDKIMKLAGKSP